MNEHPDEKIVELFIGHVAHGEVDPGGLVHDGAVVGEGLEALAAVVAAHAAVADAAEGHVVGGQVDDGVVDAPAAERQCVQHAALHSTVFREQVARQRMRPCGGEGNRFVDAADGQNRQNRAENFLLHDRTVRRNIAEDGRRNAQGSGVNTAAVDDLP